MRIGIDARFYGTYGKGLGRYTQKLISYLEKLDNTNEYFILLRKDNFEDYQPSHPRFHKVMTDIRWYTVREQWALPRLLYRLNLDLVHFTHFNVPVLYRGRFIVTIHDLILTRYPTERATTLGPVKYWIKHRAYAYIIRRAVRKAASVIAVSKYTRGEIQKQFDIPREKIVVTYEAADRIPDSDSNEQDVTASYALRKPYILYVGNVYPHKNIEGLIKAFDVVVRKQPDLTLVIVGKEDYFVRRAKEEVKRQNLEKNIIFTGYVPDRDLPIIYRMASAYVFPSLCEGFGLPALEACLWEVPVVASNSSSLPEVLGPAAYYVDPHKPSEIAKGILRMYEDPQLADALRTEGRKRVKLFSWEIMAQKTLDLYKKL